MVARHHRAPGQPSVEHRDTPGIAAAHAQRDRVDGVRAGGPGGRALDEPAAALVGPIDPDGPQGAYLQIISQLIDPARFPHLASAGPEALDDDDEDFFAEEFAHGLGLLLDGIEALIARSGGADKKR